MHSRRRRGELSPRGSISITELLTIREAVAKAAEYFKKKGVDSARLDAEILIGHAVGMDRLQVYLNLDKPLTASERDVAREFVRRRGSREPVAYILGSREFFSREFEVGPGVLVPRPETELLVEHTIAELRERFPGASELRILEFGAGSGAICVSLAAELPSATLLATEISPRAAHVARRNAEKHGVSSRVEVRIQGDFAHVAGMFHAIVANPPYIANSDRSQLPPEVVDYEPHQALFAENEGYAAYQQILSESLQLLMPGGFLIMEIGQSMGEKLEGLASAASWRLDKRWDDYSGIERVLLFCPV